MLKRWMIVGLSVSLLTGLMVASEAGKAGKKAARLAGKVKSVEVEKNTITITAGKKGSQEDKTLEVAKDAKLDLGENKTAKLSDLKPGMRVMAQLSADGKTVTGLKASEAKKKKDK